MADRHRIPDCGQAAGLGPDRASSPAYPGTPRWVKLSGLLALVLILLVVIMMATGILVAGDHGPGRHIPPGGTRDSAAPTAHEVQQPSF
jgi:hypothetical protein